MRRVCSTSEGFWRCSRPRPALGWCRSSSSHRQSSLRRRPGKQPRASPHLVVSLRLFSPSPRRKSRRSRRLPQSPPWCRPCHRSPHIRPRRSPGSRFPSQIGPFRTARGPRLRAPRRGRGLLPWVRGRSRWPALRTGPRRRLVTRGLWAGTKREPPGPRASLRRWAGSPARGEARSRCRGLPTERRAALARPPAGPVPRGRRGPGAPRAFGPSLCSGSPGCRPST